MGLLKPTEGRLLVDGADLHDPKHPERLMEWRASVRMSLRASIWLIARLLRILPLVSHLSTDLAS